MKARSFGRTWRRSEKNRKTPGIFGAYAKAAPMDGFDHFLLSQMGPYLRDHDRGAFERGGPTSDVLEITGRQPESFETITRRYAARPEAQRSVGAFLSAVVGFMSVPMRPGFNPTAFDRKLRIPQPTPPVLNADSDPWHRDHGVPVKDTAAAARGEPPRVVSDRHVPQRA